MTLALIGAMTIAGCGGGGSTPSPASGSPSPASAAASQAPAAGTATTGADSGSCGEATAALVKQHLARPDVVSVTTEGGCHDALIVTSLEPTDWAKGQAICDSAAEVAYAAGDISSITVLAASTRELAIGIKGAPCVGEP